MFPFLALDYAFSDPVDSDSDGITLFCSLRISSFLHDKHSVFLTYCKVTIYFKKRCIKCSSCEEVFKLSYVKHLKSLSSYFLL